MRTIHAPAPRKFATLAAATSGGLVHWTFSEAAGATAASFYGTSPLTAIVGATVVNSPGFFEADGVTAGKGRTFVAGDSMTATPTGVVDYLRANPYTVQMILQVDSLPAASASLLAHTSTGGAVSNDTLLGLHITSAGALAFGYEDAGGVTRLISVSSAVVPVGSVFVLGMRKWSAGSINTIIDFSINGKWVGRGSNAIAVSAGGGASNLWYVGGGPTKTASCGASQFAGKIYGVRLLNDNVLTSTAFFTSSLSKDFPRQIDFHREDARRLFSVDSVDTAVRSLTQRSFTRVLVSSPLLAIGGATSRDDLALVDLDGLDPAAGTTEYNLQNSVLISGSMSEDIDSDEKTASFVCAREVYDWRYSPLAAADSPVSPTAVRLFELSRLVRIETAVVPDDVSRSEVQPWDWHTIFDGFISKVSFGEGSDTVTVTCRDRSAPIAFTFCRPLVANSYKEKIYGDTASGVDIETVLQSIINDHVPATGMLGGRPWVYTPTSPAWKLRARSIGFEPLIDVLNQKVEQIGWVLRHEWDDVNKAFRYTFFEPERLAPAVVRTFDADEYFEISDASLNEDAIRNVCEVVYTNRLNTTTTQTCTADAGTDAITFGTAISTGIRVTLSSTGVMPTPLTAGTSYYAIALTATTARLATSRTAAFEGTSYINLITAGSATITVVSHNDGTVGDWPRARYIASDSASIALYGERYCQITEDAASQIDTSTEAQAFAESVVADLAQPKAILSVDLGGFFPWAELDDYYTFKSARILGGSSSFATTSIEHSFDASGGSTVLGLRGLPAGRVMRWLDTVIVAPGIAPYVPFLPVQNPIYVRTTALDGRVKLAWDPPQNALNRRWDVAEVHATAVVGAWTPSPSTRIGFAKGDTFVADGLNPSSTMQWKVIFRDASNNSSAAVAGADRRARHRGVSLYGRAYLGTSTAADSIPKVGLHVAGMTIASDLFGCFSSGGSPAGTRFTAPVTGFYTLGAAVRATLDDPAGLPDSVKIELVRNRDTTNTTIATSPTPMEDEEVTTELTARVLLTAGDTVDMRVLSINKAGDYPTDFLAVGSAGLHSSGDQPTWFSYQLVDEA